MRTISNFANDRGVALVAVLWIFIFLFVVAIEFASSVREEGLAAHRYAEEASGYYLALAGFEEGLYRLLNPPVGVAGAAGGRVGAGQGQDLFADCLEGSVGEGHYQACLVDEAGKINVNRVNEETLRRVFANIGIEESLRSILVDSIMDWRDSDDLHRVNGAEADYYLALSPSYSAKNGPFDTVEDLLWVRGVTPEIFYGTTERVGLREIFTVDSPMDRVNLRTASAEVCHALLGLPLEKCRAFVEERKKLSEKTLADVVKLLGFTVGDTILRQMVFTTPTVISIESAGYHGQSAVERRVKGVVRMVGGNRGLELIRWVDRM